VLYPNKGELLMQKGGTTSGGMKARA